MKDELELDDDLWLDEPIPDIDDDYEAEPPTPYTPGPWEATEGEFPDDVSIAVVGRFNIVAFDPGESDYDEAGDARLMAAAPLLVEDLTEAYHALEKAIMKVPSDLGWELMNLTQRIRHDVEDATGAALRGAERLP